MLNMKGIFIFTCSKMLQTQNSQLILDGESFQYYDPSIDELSTRSGRYEILYGTSSLDKDLKSLGFIVK